MSILSADDITQAEHYTKQTLVKRWLILMQYCLTLHYTTQHYRSLHCSAATNILELHQVINNLSPTILLSPGEARTPGILQFTIPMTKKKKIMSKVLQTYN